MRYPIWKKDDFFQFTNGTRIDMDPSVLTIPDEALGLVWNYSFAGKPLGKAFDVRLEDGEITCELEIFDPTQDESLREMLKHEDVRLGGYYQPVEKEKVGPGREIVTSGNLRAVSFVLSAAMPGARV